MRHGLGALLMLHVVVAMASGGGARADALSDAGICARCHETKAAHAPGLDCLVCHDDRRPGSFGRHHRTVPTSCTSHHAVPAATHPMPARQLRGMREQRRCLVCHDPHGSPNADLIRPRIRVGARLRSIDFHGAGDFVDAGTPGHGLCEVCHTKTDFYRSNGRGEPHFTGDCTLCHDHTANFRPVVTDANCPACHQAETALLGKPTLHHTEFSGRCSSCHAEASAAPGPGHRATSACADCHAPARVATHVPPGQTLPCTSCHEPHGSDNVRLVRDVIHTTGGADVSLRFDNLGGRVDGSFASVSAPGTGLCEVCHTRTQFYRADGSGAAHFALPCGQCHLHANGFRPE